MSNPKHLLVGGLVAMGFDATGKFLLTVSHSGRAVFTVGAWERIVRDTKIDYPHAGKSIGLEPIDGQSIEVVERDQKLETITLPSPDGKFRLVGESDGITIIELANVP